MARDRFEALWKHLKVSSHRRDEANTITRWAPADEYVYAFNGSRSESLFLGESICVDKSMSRWYGLGGSWSTIGLPHYVVID